MNFDECTFSQSTSRSYSWHNKKGNVSKQHARTFDNVHLLLVITSDGRSYFRLTTGTHNETTFLAFIVDLKERLDEERPGWTANSVLFLDNHPAHKTATVIHAMNCLKIKLLMTAPGSYLVCPVEKVS